MDCAEFQEVLPDIIESGRNAEQEAHLRTCFECSGLVADLDLISREARLLRGIEEPSPRVWNSIEIALRQEGLIRQPQREPSLVGTFSRRWNTAWLIPMTAAFLLTIGITMYDREPKPSEIAETSTPNVTTTLPSGAASHDDQQLLEVVGTGAPALRASYETDLQNVDAYIWDAQQSAQQDPNDEEVQQQLMNAYQQRAMLYEIAMDRSLP